MNSKTLFLALCLLSCYSFSNAGQVGFSDSIYFVGQQADETRGSATITHVESENGKKIPELTQAFLEKELVEGKIILANGIIGKKITKATPAAGGGVDIEYENVESD